MLHGDRPKVEALATSCARSSGHRAPGPATAPAQPARREPAAARPADREPEPHRRRRRSSSAEPPLARLNVKDQAPCVALGDAWPTVPSSWWCARPASTSTSCPTRSTPSSFHGAASCVIAAPGARRRRHPTPARRAAPCPDPIRRRWTHAMSDPVFDRMASVEDEYTLIETSLADPELLADQSRLRAVSKRYKDLTPLVECLRAPPSEGRRRGRSPRVHERRDRARTASCGARSWRPPRPTSPSSRTRLRLLMVPPDPNEGKGVIMEIRGAEGGEEANLFARDLLRDVPGVRRPPRAGRSRCCRSTPATSAGSTRSRWSCAATTPGRASSSRVARTACSGCRSPRARAASTRRRRPCSCCPRPTRSRSTIDERDLADRRVPLAAGPAARASTPPTRRCASPTCRPGSSWRCRTSAASCRTGRGRCRCCGPGCSSWPQDEREAELSAERRSQVGGGGRGEKIRTYNYKENRLTDHRIGFTIYRLPDVLAGDLDDVVDALDRRRAGAPARRASRRRRAGTITWRELWPDRELRPRRTAALLGDRPAARVAVRGGQRRRRRRVPRRARRAGDAADGRPPRRDARPAPRRRAAAVRARPLGLPPPRPDGRPAGADPAAGDRAGRRASRDRSWRRARAARRSPSPTSAPAAARSGWPSPTSCRSTASTVWLTDVVADALDVARANLAGIGRRGAPTCASRAGRGSTRCRRSCAGRRRRSWPTRRTSPTTTPDVEDVGARVGTARRAVRRRRRARRTSARSSRRRRGWLRPGGVAGARDRRRPGRGGRRELLARRRATPTSRSADLAGRDRSPSADDRRERLRRSGRRPDARSDCSSASIRVVDAGDARGRPRTATGAAPCS